MNGTRSEDKFILEGLSSNSRIQILLFVICLVMFICIIVGNCFILTAIRTEPQLQTPMYFFLSNLSFVDICYSTAIVPKMMQNILSDAKTISFVSCAAQMYLVAFLGITECLILAAMAYDRYVAICNPLRYMTIMSRTVCITLAVSSWFAGFANPLITVPLTMILPFCGHNRINHFLCELPTVLRLACNDTSSIVRTIFVQGLFLLMIPIALVLISYSQIIISILKISTTSGRHKVFSTCSSHLTVVILFYSTAMYIYMKPPSFHTEEIDKGVTVVYTVITPLLNPVIYTLRNKEVKGTLKKRLQTVCFQT